MKMVVLIAEIIFLVQNGQIEHGAHRHPAEQIFNLQLPPPDVSLIFNFYFF